jgi:hypothetical protein
MSLFVEVFDVEKNCPVIINLDTVMEIAPLREGGCILFFPDSASVNGKATMKVKDSYNIFKQFVLQTVSSEDIAKNIARMSNIEKEPYPETNLPPEAEKRGRGRPPKSMVTTTADLASPHVD